MQTLIHPTAVIDSKAELDSSVQVGPYSVIGRHVKVDAGTVVGPHVVIEGHTSIGRNNQLFQFSSIGAVPQDKKYAGEDTRVEIGDGNVIREFCTINLGTVQDAYATRMGNDNWIMAYVHIAHDCQLGNHLIMANNAQLAGHVKIDDWVFLGGFSTVHQFCRIGTHAMTSYTAAVGQDVPPFVTVAGNRAVPVNINSEGLKRRGYSSEHIMAIKRAYKLIYRAGLSLEEAKAALLQQKVEHPEFAPSFDLLHDFLNDSKRGIAR